MNATSLPAAAMRHSSPFAGGRLLGNLIALALLGTLGLYGLQSLTGWWGAPPFLGCWLGQLCLWLLHSGVGPAVATIAFLVWMLSRFRSTPALVALVIAMVLWSMLQRAAIELLAGCS